MSREGIRDRALREATKETTYREADRDENKDQRVKRGKATEGRKQLRKVRVRKVNRLEIPKGVSDRVKER